MNENEKIIHVKLEYPEAHQAKRSLLLSEFSLLKIKKAVKEYEDYRNNELKVKANLYKKIKELKTNLGKLQQILPKLKVPEKLKEEDKTKLKSKIQKNTAEDNLETELKEIQERLRKMQ